MKFSFEITSEFLQNVLRVTPAVLLLLVGTPHLIRLGVTYLGHLFFS